MTNLSLQALRRSGERPAILGLVADGPHPTVVRALGPSLAAVGVDDMEGIVPLEVNDLSGEAD